MVNKIDSGRGVRTMKTARYKMPKIQGIDGDNNTQRAVHHVK